MAVTYEKDGGHVYVRINGCLGGKACKNQQEAERYAQRVDKGLAHFEPLSETAIRDIQRSRNLTRD